VTRAGISRRSTTTTSKADPLSAARTPASTDGTDALTIRTASAEDAEFFWRWANDAETRRWSFQSAPIAWETHVAWLDAKLADPSKRVFIVGDGATPKAVVRFEPSGEDAAVVSVVVDPDARGRGWGTRALEVSCRTAASELALKRVDAFIKPDNTASLVVFERAGFARIAEAGRPGTVKMVWHPEPQ
jgi:RimJ/RimL family protein N-acetyltransferase